MKDAEIQHWLKKVEKPGVNILLRAMLGADEETVQRIYRNMSEAAVGKFIKEFEKVKLLEITPAEIEYNAKRLEQLF